LGLGRALVPGVGVRVVGVVPVGSDTTRGYRRRMAVRAPRSGTLADRQLRGVHGYGHHAAGRRRPDASHLPARVPEGCPIRPRRRGRLAATGAGGDTAVLVAAARLRLADRAPARGPLGWAVGRRAAGLRADPAGARRPGYHGHRTGSLPAAVGLPLPRRPR